MQKKFESIDIYGHPISVLYKGGTSHKTICGSIATLCTRTLFLILFILLLLNMLIGGNRETSYKKVLANMSEEGPVNLPDYDFNLAIWQSAFH